MATKKKRRRSRPAKGAALQFSKKLSATVTAFWILYRLAQLVAAVLEPTISNALVELVAGVDTVMMVNLGFYSGNSVAEKAILAWTDRWKNEKDNDEEGSEDTENP